MAKKIFKERQRFNRPELYALLLFLILGLTYRFCETYLFGGTSFDTNAMGFIGFIVLLGAALFYFWKLRLDITLSKKGLQYRYGIQKGKKRKIKWEDIERFQFVETPSSVQYSGWNVQFQNDEEQYSLCGRNGVQIVTKDGERVFLGSKNLGKLKAKIQKFMSGKS